MSPQLTHITVAGKHEPWRIAGFDVTDDGDVSIGSTVISVVDDPHHTGVRDALVSGASGQLDEPDGLCLRADPAAPPYGAARAHPNGVTAIDHLVAMTPDLDRTADALDAAGLELRRRRDAQLFYWLGDVILEVVHDSRAAADAPATFWGLALIVDDLDATADLLGDAMSGPRDAVQTGRRIASLRRQAGLSVPMAFMTPHVSPR